MTFFPLEILEHGSSYVNVIRPVSHKPHLNKPIARRSLILNPYQKSSIHSKVRVFEQLSILPALNSSSSRVG